MAGTAKGRRSDAATRPITFSGVAVQQGQLRWQCNDPVPRSLHMGNAGRLRRWLECAMWILLLLPFIGLLWVPFYNFLEPSLFGFPFFYWYQLAWVPISSLLIWLVYRSRTPDEAP
jgi:Protein of unknown function (DUF3311)